MPRAPRAGHPAAGKRRGTRHPHGRQTGLRSAESRIVLCGEYSSTCRKVRRRTPHGRARQCARRPPAGRRTTPRRQGLQNMIPYYAWNASAPRIIPRAQRPGNGNAARIAQNHMPNNTYRTFFSFRCFCHFSPVPSCLHEGRHTAKTINMMRSVLRCIDFIEFVFLGCTNG